MKKLLLVSIFLLTLAGCNSDENTGSLQLLRIFIGNTEIALDENTSTGLPVDRSISVIFSTALNPSSIAGITLKSGTTDIATDVSLSSNGTTVIIYPGAVLQSNTTYSIELPAGIRGKSDEVFQPRTISFTTAQQPLTIISAAIAGKDILVSGRIIDVPLSFTAAIEFSNPINPQTFTAAAKVTGTTNVQLQTQFGTDNRSVTITGVTQLKDLSLYAFSVSDQLKGAGGEPFAGLSKEFYTGAGETLKFPLVSDEELLTLVQKQTFKYFWDFAEPASGMARERNTSGDLVTSGGSGFGIMAIIVGIERNFISRAEGIQRLTKILTFVEGADRFHGAWSHWINGTNGNVIPFSPNDNGGDLVETSFLVQGLLTFRQYLNPAITEEKALIDRINVLWRSVEWDWYTQGNQEVLYWHWSPDKQWIMNLPLQGHNETLITYVLAASSPTHTISKDVYTKGYTRNGAFKNGKSFYNITLPLGEDLGGPLFFSHYSFLGLDPRNLEDTHANYWTQNVSHSSINHAYSIANPKKFAGYSDESWGLTASDNHVGYSAHSPLNDLGVITPTAALSSFPYTPVESMKAMKFFYYKMGDRLWGNYGFYDAFNITEGWVADSYLAIDQGPIIVMIENHRTALLWNLFMSAPEVQAGLTKLGFTY